MPWVGLRCVIAFLIILTCFFFTYSMNYFFLNFVQTCLCKRRQSFDYFRCVKMNRNELFSNKLRFEVLSFLSYTEHLHCILTFIFVYLQSYNEHVYLCENIQQNYSNTMAVKTFHFVCFHILSQQYVKFTVAALYMKFLK